MGGESMPNHRLELPERIELRITDGPLLGVLLIEPMRLEIKRGKRVFEVDLTQTVRVGKASVIEVAPTRQPEKG